MAYIPRLTTVNMRNNPYWYSSRNLYYANGIYMPDCRTYCYGRWWESSDINKHFENKPRFSILPAEDWYYNISDGYERISYPNWLGAIACFTYNDPSKPNIKGLLAMVEDHVYDEPLLGSIAICCPGLIHELDDSRLVEWYISLDTLEIINMYPYNSDYARLLGFIKNPIEGGTLDYPYVFKPWLTKPILYRRKNNE